MVYGRRVTLTVEVSGNLLPPNVFRVTSDVVALRTFTARVSGDEFQTPIELDYELSGDRFVWTAIRGQALDAAMVRRISAPRISEALLGDALERFLFPVNRKKGTTWSVQLLQKADADPATFTAEGPLPDVLKVVALIYRLAYLTGQHPTRAVQRRLQLPRSTAGRWIAQARERSLLRESRGERKAGG